MEQLVLAGFAAGTVHVGSLLSLRIYRLVPAVRASQNAHQALQPNVFILAGAAVVSLLVFKVGIAHSWVMHALTLYFNVLGLFTTYANTKSVLVTISVLVVLIYSLHTNSLRWLATDLQSLNLAAYTIS
jgi:hypothetical protein